MGVFDEIGTFFTKTIPNVVTKEIPKFVTKTIPSVFERDTYAPDLPPLRKEVEALASQAETERERYFATQGRVTAKMNRYRALSEDYRNYQAGDHRGPQPFFGPKDDEKMLEELEGFEKTLKDIGQATRMVATVATLGLLELGLMHVDNANERAHLNERKTALTSFVGRCRRAIANMVASEHKIDAAIARIEAALAQAGLEGGEASASGLREAETVVAVRRELAAKLLGDGLTIEGVAAVTGLSPKDIAGIAPDREDPQPSPHTSSDLTEDEIALLTIRKGATHAI